MNYVYAHYKSNTDEIFYIGIAKRKSRFTSKKSRNPHWHNIVNKHGFYHKIIHEFENIHDCYAAEVRLIKKYGRADIGAGPLVNMTDGGEGCINISIESRNKISAAIKGVIRSDEFKSNCRLRQTGKKHSDETKKRMSDSQKQIDKSYLVGMRLSDSTKDKISKSKRGVPIGLGKVLSASHKAAISKAMTNRNKTK